MNNNNTQLLRKLNAYDYTNYAGIVQYINTRNNVPIIFPQNINTIVKQHRYAIFFTDFSVRIELGRNNIYHTYGIGRNVEIRKVIKNAERAATLQTAYYNKSNMFAAGIQLFYAYIKLNFLNITRKFITQWLRKQQIVQLIRPKKKIETLTPKYYQFGHFVIDLVEISRRPPVHNLYIMSVMDSYTRKPYFRLLGIHKTGAVVTAALQNVVNNDFIGNDIIRSIYCDNGSEFISNAFRTFCQNNNIELKFAPSHTPIATIEQLNKTLRTQLDFHHVSNRNTNVDAQMISQIQTSLQKKSALTYEKLSANDRRREAIIHNVQPYLVNDNVRAHIKTFYPKYRKAVKLGFKKNLHMHWSVVVFKISNVHIPARVSSLPVYSLQLQNNVDVLDRHGNIQKFKHIDLRKIDLNATENIRVHTVAEAMNIMGIN